MTTSSPHFSAGPSDRVYAVVITYFPDAGFPQRLAKIAAQVSRVIVVDNHTTGQSAINLEMALGLVNGVTSIRNSENLGVAAALNQGISRILSESADCYWIITFDQDSLPADNMVEIMLAVWKSHPHQEKLMLAGPRTTFIDSTSLPDTSDDLSWHEVTHVITSGSLISRRAFELAGYFNEKLFIDYVDFEYCLRLKTLGYQVIEVLETEILHNMGRLEERFILGKKIHPTHHQPLRRYYQFRNSLLLHRQYGKYQRKWLQGNRVILMKILVLILLYEKQRLRSLFQILKGIVHGLAGRSGRNGEEIYFNNATKSS